MSIFFFNCEHCKTLLKKVRRFYKKFHGFPKLNENLILWKAHVMFYTKIGSVVNLRGYTQTDGQSIHKDITRNCHSGLSCLTIFS